MPTLTETRPAVRKRLCPTYNVLLHNDDYHTLDEVVADITKAVTQVATRAAVQIMLTAHRHGRAIVITCPLEYAELHRDRLESSGLTSTLEPEG